MKRVVGSRLSLGLFIELKFCMTDFYLKCNMFVYKFASVYNPKNDLSISYQSIIEPRHVISNNVTF